MKALFLMGRASLRSGKYSQAISYLKRIPASFPRNRLADDALYLIGFNLNPLRTRDDTIISLAGGSGVV